MIYFSYASCSDLTRINRENRSNYARFDLIFRQILQKNRKTASEIVQIIRLGLICKFCIEISRILQKKCKNGVVRILYIKKTKKNRKMVWRKNQNLKNCDGSTEYLITKNQFRSKLRGRLELKSRGARRFETHHECHTTKFWGVQMSDSLAPGALKLTMRPHRAMGIPMPRSKHG